MAVVVQRSTPQTNSLWRVAGVGAQMGSEPRRMGSHHSVVQDTQRSA
eukprot:COSAG02_NODE_53339_length_302_cov_1.009852_1_plen_46_part_10